MKKSYFSFFILVAFIAFGFGCSASADRWWPRELVVPDGTDVIVPFQKDHGRCLVDVWINGKGPFSFQLDTGATAIVISPQLAELLQLSTRRYDSWTLTLFNSENEDRVAEVSQIRFGNAVLGNVPVRVTEKNFPEPVSGLLGYAAFGNRTWILDGKRQRITIKNDDLKEGSESLGDPVPMHFRYGCPFVKLSIVGRNGHPDLLLDAIIDTGFSVWPTFILPKSSLSKSQSDVMLKLLLHGSRASAYVAVAKLDDVFKIGNLLFHEPTVGFSGTFAVIGMGALDDLVLVFDPRHETLWIRRSSPGDCE